MPVDVPVDGAFAAGETRMLSLDLDTLPGDAGQTLELCITFNTDNAASARMITFGTQDIVYGPCGGAGQNPYMLCADYSKPSGVVDVVIANTSPLPGCQTGSMTDLSLHFQCT